MAAAVQVTATAKPEAIRGDHAHVYYDQNTRCKAAELRAALGKQFDVTIGRWRDQPVGPHPQAMYQVAFGTELFGRLVPWLMLNRHGLAILVHPITNHDLADHTVFPLWLGQKLSLDIDFLKKSDPQIPQELPA